MARVSIAFEAYGGTVVPYNDKRGGSWQLSQPIEANWVNWPTCPPAVGHLVNSPAFARLCTLNAKANAFIQRLSACVGKVIIVGGDTKFQC